MASSNEIQSQFMRIAPSKSLIFLRDNPKLSLLYSNSFPFQENKVLFLIFHMNNTNTLN